MKRSVCNKSKTLVPNIEVSRTFLSCDGIFSIGLEFYNNKITRRDFLKFLGSGAVVAAAGMTLGKINLGTAGNNNSQLPTALAASQTTGSWALGVKLFKTPIHASLLPNGKLFFLIGDGEDILRPNNPPFYAGILDLNTNTQNQLNVSGEISCGGNCLLPNGNVLLGGGTREWAHFTPNHLDWGLDQMYEFDFASESFIQRPSMAAGRWYPTFSLLPDGTVQIISGWDQFGTLNRLCEIYDPTSQSLSIKYDPNNSATYCVGAGQSVPGAGSPCYGGPNQGVTPTMSLYPRMYLMPNGLLAMVGQGQGMKLWDPKTGRWYFAGQMVWGTRSFGTSVLLPLQNTTTETGTILTAGGAANQSDASPATNSCELITPNSTYRTMLNAKLTNPMNFARQYLNSVILPTGQIFVTGGSTQGNVLNNAVYAAEMFDPVTNTWTILPSATVPRLYHSVAMLTQNGRIWTAGTTLYGPYSPELRTEVFSPAYMFATRPVTLGDPIITGGYGGTITIKTPNASNITAVSLLKVSSVTHHYNSDQRLIWLQIQSTDSSSVTVKAPINSNLAPPGYYLIHILDSNSVPSNGRFIKIPSK
jgi:hypothetical protein